MFTGTKPPGSIFALEKRDAGVSSIADGFKRFCAAGGGVLSTNRIDFGNEYRCAGPEGAFVGLITLVRTNGNLIQVTYDSPKRVEERASRQRAFDQRKAQNGPTGWIVTDEGKFRFLRIGTLAERHLFEVELDKSGEVVPLEDIARIEFHASCCDVDVKLRDGRTQTMNMIKLHHEKWLDISSTYGAGDAGLPVVMVDPASGQPYTRLFSNFEGVRSIELDADATKWSTVPGGS
jgi:hypothetical protein